MAQLLKYNRHEIWVKTDLFSQETRNESFVILFFMRHNISLYCKKKLLIWRESINAILLFSCFQNVCVGICLNV